MADSGGAGNPEEEGNFQHVGPLSDVQYLYQLGSIVFRSNAPLSEREISINGYVFGRERLEEDLPPNVCRLKYPFDPSFHHPNDDTEGFAQALEEAEVFIVGTAHFSPKSQEDVQRIIQSIKPDCVAVELCESRLSIMMMDEQTLMEEYKALTNEKIIEVIKRMGLLQGSISVMMLSLSAHVAKTLGMAAGGEFRAAFRTFREIPACEFVLCDRPIKITMNRVLASLSFFQKLKLCMQLLRSSFLNITQDDVEQAKEKDVLEQLLKEMSEEFPSLSRTLVEERDMFISSKLKSILIELTRRKRFAWCGHKCVPWQKVVLIAVIGVGHMRGVASNWNKDIDIAPLCEMIHCQPPSYKSKLLRFSITTLAIGVSFYSVYRIGTFITTKFSK